ncbi:uncharacterized protein C8R40DRAFT_1040909 [Lentinula edodes]|uniref:uncharacterized protein n=1 Tax=Lentinula edodes TaxID=5353 RepID=UPI001E8E86EF|nr:uncharacterized protein C8R40DRAFT_1040909 [Lentinula edodes]KAH7877289.1 hypothetical protein C8R40DRAFT_1040909 [Lentinula edodes]
MDIVQPKSSLLRSLPAHRDNIHVTVFGGQAGTPIPGSNPAQVPFNSSDGFLHYESQIPGIDSNCWAPFTSRIDWEIARWAKIRGPSSTAFSELLEIKGVCKALGLSYRSSAEINNIIDTQIPPRHPSFKHGEVVIAGEAFDFYKRDILECIRALYGSPEHARYLCVAPERHYSDADKTSRLYHDLHTGKWWWATQTALEAETPGAAIIPVILSSDKTQVTLFRNKTAYPVYLTIGNLPKEICRKPSHQGQILLTYLPTSKLAHITNKAQWRQTVANLFHACMTHLVAPLKEAGMHGIVMKSGDGVKRRCHPILAAYVGDYPEQILVTCAYYGDCPVCMTTKEHLGQYPSTSPVRDPDKSIASTKLIGTDSWAQSCLDANIKPVQYPFWEDLPFTNIFRSITPDILHQMYQGVMKHLIGEVDARVRRLPPNHSVRQFHKGILTLSQVSGMEHRAMCTFLLGIIIDVPHLTPRQSYALSTATRALLDFLYLACYPIHSNESLDILEQALQTFHDHKQVFIDLNVRQHFNVPGVHFMCRCVCAIELFGMCDNYNTETTERLHINFAKDAYRATNRKDEYAQMTKWLERQEKIGYHSTYIAWRRTNPTSIKSTSFHPVPPTGLRYDFPGAIRTLQDLRCLLTQRIAQHPMVKSVSLSKIQDTGPRGYCATQFVTALKQFIAQHRHPDFVPWQVSEMAEFITLLFAALPVWHHLKFNNQDLYDQKTVDAVSACPCRYNSRNQKTRVSRFDTALVCVRRTTSEQGDDFIKGTTPITVSHTQVGHVRVIFALPQKTLYKLFPPNITPPTHLAYVEWFSKFPRHTDSRMGMYRLKKQMGRDGVISASVVPVKMIQSSIHLYPKWGGSVLPEWTSKNILDRCEHFFVNPFRDTHTYFNLG